MKHLLHLGVLVIFLLQSQKLHSQKSSYSENYDLRPLFELDQLSTGEAYPWISDDGLRLYYTAYDQHNEVFGIWYAERDGIDESFYSHRFLDINSLDTDNISSWLSNDENTLAFVKRTDADDRLSEIFISRRNSIEDEFENAQQIIIEGGIKGTLISPSFTPDMSQLMVFNEYKSRTYLFVFERVSDLHYRYKAEIKFPKKYRVKTGNLSADGLEYYLSLETRYTKPFLYVLRRESLDSEFVSLKKFESQLINDPLERNHQVYFSPNKHFAVFTRSFENEWDSNAIFIAKNKNYIAPITLETELVLEDILGDIILYPNPSIDQIYFKNIESKDVKIQMYDAVGQLVRELEDLQNDTEINISELTPGSYYFKLLDEKAKEYRIIKHIKL